MLPREKHFREKNFVDGVAERLSEELLGLSDVVEKAQLKRILVAFSGGPDSTALLTALAQRRLPNGWQLHACHINHGLRGLESDLDQEFCENLCADLSITFSAYRLDELSYDGADVSENHLRELRYKYLFEHACQEGFSIVVTGHTLDDQSETMLFRLFRGTSPSGLTGMEARRELVRHKNIWLVRPLLKYRKADCQRFLAIGQIAAHFDSSNDSPDYARNFIRSQIVPKIDERFPGWQDRLERLRMILSEQEDWIERETEICFSQIKLDDADGEYLLLEPFVSAHMALRRRMIADLFRARGLEPSFEKIESVLSLPGSADTALTLSPDWEVRIVDDRLRWLQTAEEDQPSAFLQDQETEVHVPPGSEDCKSSTNIISWLDKSLKIEVVSGDEPFDRAAVSGTGYEIFADLSRIAAPLTVRLRRVGDVIQPFGMKEKVRLKQYLHTHKPAGLFKHTVVLTDGDEVLWVPGAGVSERLRFTNKPTHRLIFLDLSLSGDSTWA